MTATILIVDDEENALRNLSAFLEPKGYEILTATTLGQARASLERGEPCRIPERGFRTAFVRDPGLSESRRPCADGQEEEGCPALCRQGVVLRCSRSADGYQEDEREQLRMALPHR